MEMKRFRFELSSRWLKHLNFLPYIQMGIQYLKHNYSKHNLQIGLCRGACMHMRLNNTTHNPCLKSLHFDIQECQHHFSEKILNSTTVPRTYNFEHKIITKIRTATLTPGINEKVTFLKHFRALHAART